MRGNAGNKVQQNCSPWICNKSERFFSNIAISASPGARKFCQTRRNNGIFLSSARTLLYTDAIMTGKKIKKRRGNDMKPLVQSPEASNCEIPCGDRCFLRLSKISGNYSSLPALSNERGSRAKYIRRELFSGNVPFSFIFPYFFACPFSPRFRRTIRYFLFHNDPDQSGFIWNAVRNVVCYQRRRFFVHRESKPAADLANTGEFQASNILYLLRRLCRAHDFFSLYFLFSRCSLLRDKLNELSVDGHKIRGGFFFLALLIC